MMIFCPMCSKAAAILASAEGTRAGKDSPLQEAQAQIVLFIPDYLPQRCCYFVMTFHPCAQEQLFESAFAQPSEA